MQRDPNRLSVLLVEDDPDYAALVQQWLRAAPEVNVVLAWTEMLSAAVERLVKGGVDLVLLDLTLPDSEGMDTYRALSGRFPGIPIIVLSAADNQTLALQTIRAGAEDYLVKSSCSPELLTKALSYGVIRHRRQIQTGGDSARNRIITLTGAKGGAGVTTVACLLAIELRQIAKAPVLLMDLAGESGLVSFMMGVESRYSVLDLTTNLERLDADFFLGVSADANGVHVVPAPAFGRAADIGAGRLERAVRAAQAAYEWVVLDAGPLGNGNLPMLAAASDLLLVTTDSVASLYAAKRSIEVLSERGVDREALRVIVNQADSHGEALASAELEKLFRAPVYARLPFGGEEVREGPLRKLLPTGSSAFRSNVRAIAYKLAGLKPPSSRRGLPRFFSSFTRVARQDQAADKEGILQA